MTLFGAPQSKFENEMKVNDAKSTFFYTWIFVRNNGDSLMKELVLVDTNNFLLTGSVFCQKLNSFT